jgi:hypothetical protein
MGSGALYYILSFTKIGSGIQMLKGGTHRQQGDLISLLLSFQNKESVLMKKTRKPSAMITGLQADAMTYPAVRS